MTLLPPQLTPLQQSWLRELQVAAPFLKAHAQAPLPVAIPSASASARIVSPSAPALDSEPKPAPMPEEARAALHNQLGLKKPEGPRIEAVAPAILALPDLSQQTLPQLAQYAQQCTACDLHGQRQRAVVGAGEENNPDWMVISIAPSSNEEMAGLPMQGKSGELFTHQLQSIAIPAGTTFYTTQLLKCRSPQHAKVDYIQACQGILWRQIELIRPKQLLLLGQATANLFFGTATPFDQLRAQVQTWQSPWGESIAAVVTYDPVALLLRPQDKVKAWADLLLMQTLLQQKS